MAKQRMINTKFWSDNYISELDPIEKLLFLYVLTNQYTDICGIYEIPLKIIAVETGIDKEMVIKILKRFSDDDKIFYEDGWVGIKNFIKYQINNPKVNKGIEIGLNNAKQSIVDRLSIDYDRLSHSNSNSNSNLNSNSKNNTLSSNDDGTKEIMDIFYQINPTLNWGNKTTRKACQDLIKKSGLEGAKKLAQYAISVQGEKYAPTITTPYQLWNKLAELKIYHDKQNNKIESL